MASHPASFVVVITHFFFFFLFFFSLFPLFFFTFAINISLTQPQQVTSLTLTPLPLLRERGRGRETIRRIPAKVGVLSLPNNTVYVTKSAATFAVLIPPVLRTPAGETALFRILGGGRGGVGGVSTCVPAQS